MKHQLHIFVQTSYNDVRTEISPNNDETPFFINSAVFCGELRLRISNLAQPSKYFEKKPANTFCIDLRGKFQEEINGDDLMLGNEVDGRVRLPPGASLAVRILRWIDPGLECDLYAEKPWAVSPVLVTMTALNDIGTKQESWEGVEEHWQDREDAQKRRRYFANKENRKKITFKRDNSYAMEFSNGFLDFKALGIKLPGWGNLSLLPFWDGQSVCYVMRTRDSAHIVFIITFTLQVLSE